MTSKPWCLALLALVVLLVAGCCSHPVELAALRDLEAKQEKYFNRYGAYVDADPKLKDEEKAEIKGTLGAIQRQTRSIRKSIGGEE